MPTLHIKRTVSPRRKAIVYEAAIPFSQLTPEQMAWVEDALATPDPYALLRAKTIDLASLLGISEAEAEYMVLDRCGQLGD